LPFTPPGILVVLVVLCVQFLFETIFILIAGGEKVIDEQRENAEHAISTLRIEYEPDQWWIRFNHWHPVQCITYGAGPWSTEICLLSTSSSEDSEVMFHLQHFFFLRVEYSVIYIKIWF
jgi:hypothetical protein